MPLVSAEELSGAVDRLAWQVSHWQAGRWAAVDGSGAGTSRGDRVRALVQQLADLVADAEGRPHRPVPRLGDLTLPDQLRVMAGDLAAVDLPEPVAAAARAEVEAVRRAL